MDKKHKSISYAKWGYIFIIPFLIVFITCQLIPLFNTFYNSFFENYRDGLAQIGPNFVGFDNYIKLFTPNKSDPITPENTNEPYGESPVSPAIGAYFNKKAYTDPALRKEYTNKGFWVNIRLIRYADVLLMGAESANEKGIPGEAIDYLEQVRARARGTNSNILPKVTTTDQGELREAIRHERRVELGLEFDRFYDLVRWGIAKEVLHAAGKTNYQDKNALLPLPQTEIDKSKGVLVQNPDYQ